MNTIAGRRTHTGRRSQHDGHQGVTEYSAPSESTQCDFGSRPMRSLWCTRYVNVVFEVV